MRLPACCRNFATNEHRSIGPAASCNKQNMHHMFQKSASGLSNDIGCAWAAGCQTIAMEQSRGYMSIGNVNQSITSGCLAPEYCYPVLPSSLASRAHDGSVPQGVSTTTAARQCSQKAAFRQQGSMVENLVDMRPAEDIPVYVMLPLDTVNAEGVFKYAYIPWFAQALQVLALSGVHGVAVDVWWCAAERSPRQYSWTGYKQLFEMVRGLGLKLQVVLSFHACGGNVGDLAQIPLPSWVLQAGLSDPDIFFTDRPRESGLGQRNKEYLSIWADDCPVLSGGTSCSPRTPMQAYEEFMVAFKEAFHEQLGTLIEEVVIGSGPCGELRYPSYVEANGWRFPGVGEFQCYDRRALASLASAAAAIGRPEWGYTGPHDSGGYNSSPGDTGFFAPGGSWDSDYGDFFLTWYSNCLLQHGEHLLQLANKVFGDLKSPKQPPLGPLAQAQALVRRLQSMVAGSTHENGSLSKFNMAAVAAAATVAAAAAAGGVGGSDPAAVAAAAVQAKGLLQHAQQLQQHVGAVDYVGHGKAAIRDNADAGSNRDAPGDVALHAASESALSSHSCSTTDTSLGLQETDQPVMQQHQSIDQECQMHSCSIWDQLAQPEAQALATSILMQLQSSSLLLTAANSPITDCSSLTSTATAPAPTPLAQTAAGASITSSPSPATPSIADGTAMSTGVPTISTVSSSSLPGDLDLAGLMSASQQHLAALSLSASDGSKGSDMSTSSPESAGSYQQLGAMQPPYGPSGLTAASSAPAPAAAPAGALAGNASSSDMSGISVATADHAASALLGFRAASRGSSSSSSTLVTSMSGGSLTGLAPVGVVDYSSSSSSPTQPVPGNAASGLVAVPEAVALTDVATTGGLGRSPSLITMFMDALSGLGVDAKSDRRSQRRPQHRQSQPNHKHQQRTQQLIITLKIAGVHWWYNSTSHASELTAGYYNTDSRDGYGPILALCGKYGVNLTLTCVEMCDAQHPSYALCGPEGLLRQIRAMAAKQQVSLSGENALPIFTPGGVDAVALDRVVSNVRACKASTLRSCSSWPGPATTSGAAYGIDNGNGIYGYNSLLQPGYPQWQQRLQAHHSNSVLQYSSVGGGTSGYSSYQPYSGNAIQQQQRAYQLHCGAGVTAGGSRLSTGRNFSELGQLLTYQQNQQAANSCSSNLLQQQGSNGRAGSLTAGTGSGSVHAASGTDGCSNGSSQVGTQVSSDATAAEAEDPLLPAMRAFTFLRLGPEILQPEVHASWMRFMHRMLNERI